MAQTRNTKKHAAAAPEPEPEPLSPHSTEAAFTKWRPRFDALPQGAVRQPNFNLQEGALVAIAAHALLSTPEMRAKIEAMATVGALKLELVEDLAEVARAAWFVRHKLDLAEAVHSDASLPVKLVTDAGEVRKRMLKVLDYQLDEDPDAQRMLTAIRAGTGHMDLANDLVALADMYAEHEPAISSDRKNYRRTDLTLARKLADAILSSLGGPATPESQRWRNYQARAFTLLEEHHEETIRVGRFLRWYEGGEELLPTLFSAVRTRPARKRAPEEGAGEPAAGGEEKPG